MSRERQDDRAVHGPKRWSLDTVIHPKRIVGTGRARHHARRRQGWRCNVEHFWTLVIVIVVVGIIPAVAVKVEWTQG